MPENSASYYEGGFDEQVIYWIPVQVMVYRNSHNPHSPPDSVMEAIRLLNAQFSGLQNITGQAHPHTKIQFYLKCGISYYSNSTAANNPSDAYLQLLFQWNNAPGALNLHVIDTYSWAGMASINEPYLATQNPIHVHPLFYPQPLLHRRESGLL